MRTRRVLVMTGLVGLHVVCYWAATRIAVARGAEALWRTATPLDLLIPHLPATWPLYWIAYPFIVLGCWWSLRQCEETTFRRAVGALAGMTVVGAAIQAAFPAIAPWPATPAPSQRAFHESALVLPYATLPSMHVAYCAVTAGLLGTFRPGRLVRSFAAAIVGLVAVATLTLKEHVVLDAVSGLTLAGLTLWWWRRGLGERIP